MNALPGFSFQWPSMLWLLLCIPLLAGLYLRHERRRRRAAVRYPALQFAGLALRGAPGWRRHLPPALVLLGLAALIAAIARPQAVLMLPSNIETVMLAMDMSGSMRADDVKPTRMRAAQQAAEAFIAEQPSSVRVGVVAVAGTASVAQLPSRRKDEVRAAIERMQPQRGSALGNGLIIALTTLLPQAGIDVARFMDTGKADAAPPSGAAGGAAGGGPGGGSRAAAAGASGGASSPPGTAGPPDSDPPTPGSYPSGAIVLFSDGEGNAGPTVLQAAQVAADHGVRIYTVGIGTADGAVLSVEGWSARVKLDDTVLKQVADMTGAEYFRVDDADGLKQVYRTLSARMAFDKRDLVEITALFAALGALLAACTALLSLWWFGRVL